MAVQSQSPSKELGIASKLTQLGLGQRHLVEGLPSSSVVLKAESPATGSEADPKELVSMETSRVCLLGSRRCTWILKGGQTLAMFIRDNHTARGHESCVKIKIGDGCFSKVFIRDTGLLSV